MCGIAGFYRWGPAYPTREVLSVLWAVQESRGKDAAGVAWCHDGKLMVKKAADPARKVIKSVEGLLWEQITRSRFGLFHARAETQGPKANNENNHPVVGSSTVLTHNGVIRNDDDLFQHFSPEKRFAAVDSAAISLMLEQGTSFEDGLQHLTLLDGSATFAAWSQRKPDHITLVRMGFNDLWLFYDPPSNILYWSSVASAAQLFVFKRLACLPLVLTSRLEDRRILLLSPDGPDSTTALTFTANPFTRRKVVVRSFSGFQTPSTPRPAVSEPKVTQLATTLSAANGPPPQLPEPGGFAWDKHNIWDAERTAREQNKTQVLVTALGRWLIEPNGDKKFKAFKGTKKWWYKNYPANGLPILPATKESPLQNHFRLIPLSVHEELSTKAMWISKGFLCPLCGAWARELVWLRADGTCKFCNVASISPRET